MNAEGRRDTAWEEHPHGMRVAKRPHIPAATPSVASSKPHHLIKRFDHGSGPPKKLVYNAHLKRPGSLARVCW